jgi:MYXO-CTERM domain-containing protein
MGLVLAACAAGSGVARADVVDMTPLHDTTLYEAGTERSNGSGDYLFAGHTSLLNGAETNVNRRALVLFDIASLVPVGSRIDSVSLDMYVSRAVNDPNVLKPVTLYRVTSSWAEGSANAVQNEGGGAPAVIGDATWNYRSYNTQLWTTPGGDFVGTASGTTYVFAAGDHVVWDSTTQMVADVQYWLDHPTSNFGWILIGDEETPESVARFNSRNNVDSTTWPMLTVTYTLAQDLPPAPPAVPEPAAATLLGLAALATLRRR